MAGIDTIEETGERTVTETVGDTLFGSEGLLRKLPPLEPDQWGAGNDGEFYV